MEYLVNEFNINEELASKTISEDFISNFTNPMVVKAYQAALDKGNITIDKTTHIEAIQAITAELQTMGEEGQKTYELIEAAGIDAMKNIYNSMAEKEKNAA